MITLYSENLAKISKKHGLSAAEVEFEADRIGDFLNLIHKRDQGFYKIPDDHETLKKISNFCNTQKGKFEDIVVLGIGGSSLGTICLQQSLKPQARLHVVDNIDPTLITETEAKIDLSKTLFIVVTKSGSTPEILAQFFYFANKYKHQNLSLKTHFKVITDPKPSTLRSIAKEENIEIFDIPLNVGGRFSVLTAVGLLPAGLIGIDIEKLIKGAKEMRESFLSKDHYQNLPFQLATIQYLLHQKGKNINVMMPYSQRLIRFADWYRQLLAESIGKRLNDTGQVVNVGITPINALGVTDQHSQSQLYNEGPNDKLHIFIKVKNLGAELQIPSLYPESSDLKYLKNVSFNKLMSTELMGTMDSLAQNDRPNVLLEMDEVNEEHLGAMFMLFEAATAFLGEYFEINAFDQPGVELSKQITRKLLTKNNIQS